MKSSPWQLARDGMNLFSGEMTWRDEKFYSSIDKKDSLRKRSCSAERRSFAKFFHLADDVFCLFFNNIPKSGVYWHSEFKWN